MENEKSVEKSSTRSKQFLKYNLWLPMLLFGSIGAITWAIRGTSGWGGVDGTVLPALMWGVLWYYLSAKNGIEARHIILWLGLGLALGGELGYGQYVGWIQGNFQVGNEIMHINPLSGYAWLIMCGIGWAAPGGIVLGWTLGKQTSVKIWIVRAILLVVLLFILFDWPLIEMLGRYFVKIDPGILFPHLNFGFYSANLDKHLSRTVYTNTQNFLAVLWWFGALIIATWQRDKTTLITGLIIGGGFGLGFMQSAIWTLGYVSAPKYIDWWKLWELNAGFNLGVLYAITLYWWTQKILKNKESEKILSDDKRTKNKNTEWLKTLFLAFGGFLLLFLVGFEYFLWTGLALSLIYFLSMIFTTTGISDSYAITERRKNVLLIYSIFYLVFLMFHGVSERLGIFLGLYAADVVAQYSWPIERIVLFSPIALLITGMAIYKLWQVLRPNAPHYKWNKISHHKSLRIVDLMTVMTFIGALSIWPQKIGVLYVLLLCIAIWAFNRLNNYYKLGIHKIRKIK